jgi:hypothetical protein
LVTLDWKIARASSSCRIRCPISATLWWSCVVSAKTNLVPWPVERLPNGQIELHPLLTQDPHGSFLSHLSFSLAKSRYGRLNSWTKTENIPSTFG